MKEEESKVLDSNEKASSPVKQPEIDNRNGTTDVVAEENCDKKDSTAIDDDDEIVSSKTVTPQQPQNNKNGKNNNNNKKNKKNAKGKLDSHTSDEVGDVEA